MDYGTMLHLLRNPWGHSDDEVRQARLAAADELERWRRTVDHPGSAVQWIAEMQPQLYALRARVAELEAMNKMLCGKLDDQRRALWDPCAPYLKDGETPAECIVRNRRDVDIAMASMVRDRDDALRYRWLRIVDGNQWGVLGLTDPDGLDAAIDAARATSNKPAAPSAGGRHD